MICVTCGKENPEDSKFCCNCGNPLVDDKQNGNCEEQESAGNYREQLICGNNSESVNAGNCGKQLNDGNCGESVNVGNCGGQINDGNCGESVNAGNCDKQMNARNCSESVNAGDCDKQMNAQNYSEVAAGNSSELRCPHCNSTNLVRNQRQGCLGWIGEVLGFGLLIGIIYAIGWKGLANFLYEASPFLILLSFIYMIYQKMKPDWTWDMECKDCGHTFEYDSSLKRIKTK